MKFGLPEEHYRVLEEKLIKPIKSQHVKIYIFGSRAKGAPHKYSDVDILVDDSAGSVNVREISRILDWFENSNFPYKIDLVYESQLADSYRQDVEASRREL